jgi:hypothetical protein
MFRRPTAIVREERLNLCSFKANEAIVNVRT